LISASDLIITDGSNIGIEAILAKKPLITANFESIDENDVVLKAINETNSSIRISKYENLEKSVMRIFRNEQEISCGQQKIMDRYNFKNDGLTGKRIFNELISSGNSNKHD